MILLTTDLSEESTNAFAPACELARQLGMKVVLLHVVEDLKVPPHGSPLAPAQSSPEVASEIAEANTKLEEMRQALLRKSGADVEALVLTGEHVAGAITDYAASHGAAFIALCTHGRTGIRHLVLGSVAEAVLRHARTPVICFPVE